MPVYPTLSAEQVAFIIRDSEATLAIVSTPTQLAKVLESLPTLPELRTIVLMEADRRVSESGGQ